MGEKQGWFSRLTKGLRKTSEKLSHGIVQIFTKRKLDEEALQELEDLLLTADMGVGVTARLLEPLRKTRFGQEVTDQEVREVLATHIAEIMEPYTAPLKPQPGKTKVVLIVGVNGSGKTTTLSKLAAAWQNDGLKIRLVAGDTFRAAAVEQLKVWGERLGVPVVAAKAQADAAGLIFEAFQQAQKAGDDVLLVDTAGRLHNRQDLMAELEKIVRVLKKVDEAAPHHTVLVVDATIGQNAYAQVEAFSQFVPLSGLVMTKLDGTARGGVLVGIVDKFHLPVHAIGVGEQAEDLQPFHARHFAQSLVGVVENDQNTEHLQSA